MSAAEITFNSFKDYESLQQAIKNGEPETIYLEFKQKSNHTNPQIDRDDKANFANGLSQFANSDGGVQIWGVKTTKIRGIDIASALVPIKDVDIFINNLETRLKDAVQPLVEGVKFQAIFENDTSKDGFAKILIPASSKTPHRSMATREYFKRTSLGKVPMEHFDLEDMFGRRQKPLLRLQMRIKNDKRLEFTDSDADDQGFLPPATYEMYIHNSGKALGKESMLVIELPEAKVLKTEIAISRVSFERIDHLNKGIPTLQIDTTKSILYPNTSNYLGDITFQVHKSVIAGSDNISIKWAIHAENMLTQEGNTSFFSQKLIDIE